MQNEHIGFVGLGYMGHGMAHNLLIKGHALTVLGHRNRTPVEDLVSKGAREARTAAELARESTVVVLCVTGSAQVEALVRGPEGIAAGARPGTILVDTSTSNPNSTLALAEELRSSGVTLVDAPLGRTPKEAWTGTLDVMVGCDEAIFARLKPVLDAFAGRVVRVGGVGDGHKMKLVNNFLSMGYAALYSEALALAAKNGLMPRTVDGVIRGGRMDCGFYQTFMQYVLERDRDAHKFTLRNGLKDMTYVDAMGDAAGFANPLANAVKNAFATAVAAGRGDDFVPMLSDIVAELNGTSLVRPGEADGAG
jgi:hypothetical protein